MKFFCSVQPSGWAQRHAQTSTRRQHLRTADLVKQARGLRARQAAAERVQAQRRRGDGRACRRLQRTQALTEDPATIRCGFSRPTLSIGATISCSALCAIRKVRHSILGPGFWMAAGHRTSAATHMITATVFLFIDSSMASCVSCAVSSSSWNCVSPACAVQPGFTSQRASHQPTIGTSSVG